MRLLSSKAKTKCVFVQTNTKMFSRILYNTTPQSIWRATYIKQNDDARSEAEPVLRLIKFQCGKLEKTRDLLLWIYTSLSSTQDYKSSQLCKHEKSTGKHTPYAHLRQLHP